MHIVKAYMTVFVGNMILVLIGEIGVAILAHNSSSGTRSPGAQAIAGALGDRLFGLPIHPYNIALAHRLVGVRGSPRRLG